MKGILSDTDEETTRRPIAVKSGRRSGRASAAILRRDVEVEEAPPVLGADEREAGRRRERMERRIGGGEDDTVCDGGGARRAELAAKKRFWAEANAGDGGCRRLVEGCAKTRLTERAPRPRAPEECAEAATMPRKGKQNIEFEPNVPCCVPSPSRSKSAAICGGLRRVVGRVVSRVVVGRRLWLAKLSRVDHVLVLIH